MQKDLENLAKEMQKEISMESEREHYLFNMEYCRKVSRYKRNIYSEEQNYQVFRRILVLDLSRRLIGSWSALRQLSESPKEDIALYIKVRKGIDAFVLASSNERRTFRKIVHGKLDPKKIATKVSSKSAMTEQNQGRERN